jgi:exodeoxyribonuclease VII large subunit
VPLESTAENPIPVRTVANAIGAWVAKLGRVWIEGQLT